MDDQETEHIQEPDWDQLLVEPVTPSPPSISRSARHAIWQEVLEARQRLAFDHWHHYQKSPAQLLDERPDGWTDEDELRMIKAKIERITSTAFKNLSWDDIAELSHLTDEGTNLRAPSEEAIALWKETMEYAREELLTGDRASDALESYSSTPLDRARFIVLYDSFVEQWQPNGGVERALIAQMAQAYTLWERWLKNAALRQNTMWTGDQKHVFERSVWAGPPQTEADATKAAGDEADRWHRVYVRALRQLRDLRRYNVNITAGQVNIAQQQVNVANPPETDRS